jgi:hypothetical protein
MSLPDLYAISEYSYAAFTEELTALIANLPGASLITEKMKTDALAVSLVPDALGVWPGFPNYVVTVDLYYAALQLINFLRGQPVIRNSSSEGTSVSVDAPDWASIMAYYKSMSVIAKANSSDLLKVVYIPDPPHVKKVPMGSEYGRGSSYDNVDTDLG